MPLENLFIAEMEKIINYNRSKIKKNLKKKQNLIVNLFNYQSKLSHVYLWTLVPEFRGEVENESTSILAAAYIKNLFSIYSAYRLLNDGLYGPARIILRNSFEFLILSKYCSLASNKTILEKWENGNSKISLMNDVLNKIKIPNNKEFVDFWRMLNQFCHASIYSLQPNMKIIGKEQAEELCATYIFIQILLECNYHLLNSYFINPSMKFYGEFYNVKKIPISEIRRRIRKLHKLNKKDMSEKSRKLIYDYKLKWLVK